MQLSAVGFVDTARVNPDLFKMVKEGLLAAKVHLAPSGLGLPDFWTPLHVYRCFDMYIVIPMSPQYSITMSNETSSRAYGVFKYLNPSCLRVHILPSPHPFDFSRFEDTVLCDCIPIPISLTLKLYSGESFKMQQQYCCEHHNDKSRMARILAAIPRDKTNRCPDCWTSTAAGMLGVLQEIDAPPAMESSRTFLGLCSTCSTEH